MKLFLTLCCVLLSCAFAQASPIAHFNSRPSLPELVQEGKIICIGTVRDVQTLDRTQVDTGYKHTRNGPDTFVPAQNAVANFDVDATLASSVTGARIKIAFYKNIPHGFNPSYFVELVPGERVVVFLSDATEKGNYQLAEPASNGLCKIQVGPVAVGGAAWVASTATLTPLRRTMLVLALALAPGDSRVRLDCLTRLGSVGYLLYADPAGYLGAGETQTRTALGEPPGSELEDFVRDRILPAVLKLTASQDAKLRAEATYSAIKLQDADLLPALITSDPATAIEAIRGLQAPSSLYVLVPLLKSHVAGVRSASAYTLWQLNNPLALPFLLDDLDDADADTRNTIINALISITKDYPPGSSSEPKSQEEAKDLAFWRLWKVKHKDQLASERAQFLKDAHPASVGPATSR